MTTVSDFHLLRDHDELKRRGLFVAEGRLVVRRLVDDGRYRFHSVLVSPAARASLASELSRLEGTVPVYECPTQDFLTITGHNIHRGCLALVERPTDRAATEVLANAHTALVLDGVANADNVGGVFRNAAAFGVDAVLLGPGCGDPLYRKSIRTSMAASTRVPFARLEPWPDALQAMRACGWTLVALTPHGQAVTLDEFAESDRPERLAWLVGAEGAGLSEAALACASVCVRIPIRDEVDSLNLAVATGIALARITKLTKSESRNTRK